MTRLIGEEWFPVEYLEVKELDHSIAQYEIENDLICLGNWAKWGLWFRHVNEEFLPWVTRTILHEEMHRILFKFEGKDASWSYDFITRLDGEDLP